MVDEVYIEKLEKLLPEVCAEFKRPIEVDNLDQLGVKLYEWFHALRGIIKQGLPLIPEVELLVVDHPYYVGTRQYIVGIGTDKLMYSSGIQERRRYPVYTPFTEEDYFRLAFAVVSDGFDMVCRMTVNKEGVVYDTPVTVGATMPLRTTRNEAQTKAITNKKVSALLALIATEGPRPAMWKYRFD